MKDLNDRQTAVLVVVSILINLVGKYTAYALGLPLWLDAVGTILTAFYLGPVCGAIVGASVNIIYGLQDPLSLAYLLVNIITGVAVGMASQRGCFSNFFEVTSIGSAIAILSAIFSTPLNYFLYNGYTGNEWGDGIINLLKEWDFHNGICYLLGEFYLDFQDKILSTLIVFAMVKFIDKRFTLQNAAAAAFFFFVSVISCSGGTASAAWMGDTPFTGYNSYVQNVYNSSTGLLGGEANDIVSAKDGLLWIGTYGGLYRYNGTEFKRMNDMESVKNVNCLFVDIEGRIWVGTNDDGLSICINQKVANVIDERAGLPSNSVRAIGFSSDGCYYVGTTSDLCVITLSSGISIQKTFPEIVYAKRISTDENKNTAVITDAGELFLLRQAEIVEELTADSSAGYIYTSCAFDAKGRLYVGTSSNVVEYFDIRDGRLVKAGSMVCSGIRHINTIQCDEEGRIFLCSDFGVGYIYNGQFKRINTNKFNSQIDNMAIDYQGNLWFTSSHQGLLRLCSSPFVDVYSETELSPKVVNAVTKWNNRIYFGTDNGIDVIDFWSKLQVEDSLSSLLAGVRIRSLVTDSRNHLWVCTSGNGVYEVDNDGSWRVYTQEEGTLGNKQRYSMELPDGTMAVAGDKGLTFIRDGAVVRTMGKEQGLTNTRILTMSLTADGRIAAGTDGSGIFIIDNYQVVQTIQKENGLSSNVVLRTTRIDDGMLVATTSGLCYIDKYYGITKVHNFPYSNNFDIIEKNGKLWIMGGAGIYIVDKDNLINDNLKDFELLDTSKGLRSSITANAWNYLDPAGNLFVSCDSGVYMINMNHYNDSIRSYRMSVKNIRVDGVLHHLNIGDVINIPRGATKLELFPEVINYSINNPYVMYYLEGFDDKPIILPQREMTGSVVYTNLPSKEYTFHLAVMDDKKGKVLERLSYRINKEKEIYDNTWFLVYSTIVFVLAVVWATWFIVRTQVQKTIRYQQKELALVKRQLEMGNETVMAIARTLDARDDNTSQHALRVSEYSVMIARKLGFDEEACENLRKAALLHDIGKIGIPDSVLNKPDKLTDEEYSLMKSHVVLGDEILKDFTLIDGVSEGALYHHERYDGRGYVHGLKGEEIPLNARIIGIADAFDAMTANRVYRKRINFDFVVEEIKRGRGTQFDPQMVDIMLELIDNGDIDVNNIYREGEQ